MKLLESLPRIFARNLIVMIFNDKARPQNSTIPCFLGNVMNKVLKTE